MPRRVSADLLALVDRDRLAGFVREHAPLDGTVELDVLSGGHSNITYLLRSGRHHYVVRRRPIGAVPAGAHDMAREHRVLAALQGGPVPVPAVFGFCDDETVLGAPFYVMSRVHGDVLHRRDDVSTLSPDQAGDLSRTVVDVLDRLHRVDADAVGLGDLGRPQGFVARRIGRWLDQWRRGPHREQPLVGRLGAQLAAAVPAHADATLIHGDYRLGNLLVTAGDPAGGPVGVAAVLDWEMSTLGDPLTDLAHLLVYWEPTRGRQTHESQAIAAHPGFLTGSELAERYAAASGRGLDDLGFYLAFEHWRAAIIKESIVGRLGPDDAGAGAPDQLGESVGRHLEEAADLLRTPAPR
ncbi:MAG TPA: phosphotransferase family protein [Acidimicrobiales bacterium]|nr:phosphotransferase family protein [Acidimicrobiales bacterium]